MSDATLNQTLQKEWNGKGFDGHSAILRLARSLNGLKRKFPESISRFDAEWVERCLGLWSSGEVVCALFVLSVWAGECKTFPGFDLIDGVSRIDQHDRAIIADWVMNPWWP